MVVDTATSVYLPMDTPTQLGFVQLEFIRFHMRSGIRHRFTYFIMNVVRKVVLEARGARPNCFGKSREKTNEIARLINRFSILGNYTV